MATNNATNTSNPISVAQGGTTASSMTNTDGVVYYNGTALLTTNVGSSGQLLTSSGSGFAPYFLSATTALNIQVFTYTGSSQTYTPTPGMSYCTIEVIGGGGGGGGMAVTGSHASAGSGGGAGGYARLTASAATIGASQTVTVGAAGGGGAAGAHNGTGGGTTSVGSLVSATGGGGEPLELVQLSLQLLALLAEQDQVEMSMQTEDQVNLRWVFLRVHQVDLEVVAAAEILIW